jgi:preprotein translocase SecF subunit
MLKFIPDDINVDFMGARTKAFALSGLLVLASILAVIGFGFNEGIDFKGGSSVILAFQRDAAVDRTKLEQSIAALIASQMGAETDSHVTVQDFDSGVSSETEGKATTRYLVYTEVPSLISKARGEEIAARLQKDYGADTRVNVPNEGADIFYITFADKVGVTERYDALRKTYADLGYAQVAVVSDVERISLNDCYQWVQLLGDEVKTGPDAEGDDIDAQLAACEARVANDIKGKQDRRFSVTVEELKAKVAEQLAKDFGDAFITVESSTSVSPSVGKDLLSNGLLAVLYAIIGILIYITLRFDFRYAPGAVVALVHDVAITMGLFALFQIKFSLPIIAALLTIVGYSLNDTIVVLDRVRETFDAYRGRDIKELLNRAINATLSRTVLTSLTTAFVVAAILVLGGGLIRDFAIALMIGIVVGTYSSIFVATPLVYYMDAYIKRREAAATGKSPKPSPA